MMMFEKKKFFVKKCAISAINVAMCLISIVEWLADT